jgi:penicillin-binding protein 2
MIQLPDDRRPPLTPQLALRAAILGSFALAMFAIIFFRLWFLQVLSGNQYLAQAAGNQVRDIAIAAPRGQILDRSGNILVDNVPSIAVQITPGDLPKAPARQRAVYRRLAGVLGISTRPKRCPVAHRPPEILHLAEIPCAVAQQHALLPYRNVTVKTDVLPETQYYLAERQDEFPGVSVEQIWLRSYPLTRVAAQLFGTVGPISPTEVHQARYRGASQQAIVGQSGLEAAYDRYLRGKDGANRLQVDALGNFKGYLSQAKPIGGYSLKLSLDLGLQRAGEQALQDGIDHNPPASAGAFVALDPRTGEVLAMGSNPSYDPNIFAKRLSYATYKALNNPATNHPLVNRAMGSPYPTGSTFKAITATAALQSGTITPSTVIDDPGSVNISGQTFKDAGGVGAGSVSLVDAIRVSSDVFFYTMGARMNPTNPLLHPEGGPLQHWAHQFGIGRKTGIDVPGEFSGILPSPAWRAMRNQEELACEHRHHDTIPCGFSDLRPWSIGDNVQLATGQGDLEATPLQMAVVYAAIENGGTIVRPHVGSEVVDANGTVQLKVNPPAQRQISIDPGNLDAIRAGLHAAASQAGGTSADVFASFPQNQYPVYGKTGTAQHSNAADQSWYVCYVPDATRPIVVAVTLEQGGFGAQAAAPAAREILSQWFLGHRGQFIAGASRTR